MILLNYQGPYLMSLPRRMTRCSAWQWPTSTSTTRSLRQRRSPFLWSLWMGTTPSRQCRKVGFRSDTLPSDCFGPELLNRGIFFNENCAKESVKTKMRRNGINCLCTANRNESLKVIVFVFYKALMMECIGVHTL